MKQLCDVLVIGAGIVGAATAFALTRAGSLRVTVVEKGPVAGGMTRRSAGLAHPFQAHPALVRYALDSFSFYRDAPAELGSSKSDFVTTGAALVGGSGDAAKLFARAQMLAPFTREVTTTARGALAAEFPGVSPQLQAGLFTLLAGYADAAQMTQRLVRSAQARGLNVVTGTQVKQIHTAGGRVLGAVTTNGEYEAPVVIVAAGGWSNRVLATARVTLPLHFLRGAVLFYEQPAAMSQGHPLFWDVNGEFFVRPHSYRLSAAGSISAQAETTNLEPPDEYVSPAAGLRVSQFVSQCLMSGNAQPKRAHTIVYDTAADGLPVMGPVPGIEGLVVAAGFGAATFAVAPAVGDTMARMVIDSSAPPETASFHPIRFKDKP